MHGKDNDPDVRKLLHDSSGRLKTVETSHGDIHENDLGLFCPHQFQYFPAITSFPSDDCSSQFLQLGTYTCPHYRMVVCQDDPDTFFSSVHRRGLPPASSASAMETRHELPFPYPVQS